MISLRFKTSFQERPSQNGSILTVHTRLQIWTPSTRTMYPQDTSFRNKQHQTT